CASYLLWSPYWYFDVW
nr:immunoglobulin heavy chain junction region [Mus musculus]